MDDGRVERKTRERNAGLSVANAFSEKIQSELTKKEKRKKCARGRRRKREKKKVAKMKAMMCYRSVRFSLLISLIFII